MAESIDPKSVKLLVDGVELPFPVVAAPLSWGGVQTYPTADTSARVGIRFGGSGGKSKALAEHVATLDPDARIAVAGPLGVKITTAGEYSRSYAATFVPATESETVDGEQVLGELIVGDSFDRVIIDDVLGSDGERVAAEWPDGVEPPPVRDWPRRGYDREQVRAVLQWVTSAGEFTEGDLYHFVRAAVFGASTGDGITRLRRDTQAAERSAAIVLRVLRRAKRDRVVAWSHHSRCYVVRPAWQWRRRSARWPWPLPHSDSPSVDVSR